MQTRPTGVCVCISNGLLKGNNVLYKGINIGMVNTIEMVNDSAIKVVMSLDEKMTIYINKNAVSSIGSDGLVGNMIVNMLPGEGIAEPTEYGDAIKSFSKIGPNDVLSVTVKNAEVLTEDLLRIINSINKGQGTLSILLNDTLMASDLKASIRNVTLSGFNASNTIYELNSFVCLYKRIRHLFYELI
ncbi:MlaD family protein [Formosa sp. PL04]|uniref:MlaD family protein n=1 Tax=Formosa sp. PL04 TaxID=3081755 RepID=UPI0029816EBB|nr:MlaD family protein [Formosa sp. PL04]MDW5290877.1 MlaD family protein [Formosa sp. PL04]